MRPVQPTIEVPGDNADELHLPGRSGDEVMRQRIMARSGNVVGMSVDHVVWRFGFCSGSEAANAFGVEITEVTPADTEGESEPPTPNQYGFLWVLATRRTAKVKATFRGYALELPDEFRKVIEWEPRQ